MIQRNSKNKTILRIIMLVNTSPGVATCYLVVLPNVNRPQHTVSPHSHSGDTQWATIDSDKLWFAPAIKHSCKPTISAPLSGDSNFIKQAVMVITFALRGGYVIVAVCSSVRLSVRLFGCEQHHSKNLFLDFHQIFTHCPHLLM